MKKVLLFLLCICLMLSSVGLASAEDYGALNGELEIVNAENSSSSSGTRATGLIRSYSLHIEREGSTLLKIYGLTSCDLSVVRCGFKGLKVQRRLNSSSSWTTYHDYGNDYIDSDYYAIGFGLNVEPGYQYRLVCKHYAKKNILSIETISNQTGYVAF